MKFNLDNLVAEFSELENKLGDPEVFKDQKKVREVATRKKSIEEAVVLYKEYKALSEALSDNKQMLGDEKDEEMRELLKMEIAEAEETIPKMEERLKVALLPKDPNDDKNIIVELRAGTGWDEAALFAWELARSYLTFAESEWFKIEITEQTESESGGVKEIIFEIKWEWAYSRFKYESGVHRVQRIPETESKGRVHTSAITVAIIVLCSDGRSQHKNRDKAFNIMRSKLHVLAEEKRAKEMGEARLSQVGSGDRSEKIRTYNFPQDRVTDHRIGQNFSWIPQIMVGKLWPIIDACAVADQQAKLEAAGK